MEDDRDAAGPRQTTPEPATNDYERILRRAHNRRLRIDLRSASWNRIGLEIVCALVVYALIWLLFDTVVAYIVRSVSSSLSVDFIVQYRWIRFWAPRVLLPVIYLIVLAKRVHLSAPDLSLALFCAACRSLSAHLLAVAECGLANTYGAITSNAVTRMRAGTLLPELTFSSSLAVVGLALAATACASELLLPWWRSCLSMGVFVAAAAHHGVLPRSLLVERCDPSSAANHGPLVPLSSAGTPNPEASSLQTSTALPVQDPQEAAPVSTEPGGKTSPCEKPHPEKRKSPTGSKSGAPRKKDSADSHRDHIKGRKDLAASGPSHDKGSATQQRNANFKSVLNTFQKQSKQTGSATTRSGAFDSIPRPAAPDNYTRGRFAGFE